MSSDLIAAYLAPIFIAASISAVKFAGVHAHPLLIAGIAPLLALPFLALWMKAQKLPLSFGMLQYGERIALIKLILSRCILGQILIVAGFTETTAVKAVLLLRLEPLFVLIWGVLLLNERPQPKKLILTLLLLLGAVLVVSPADEISRPTWGDLYILLALAFLSYSYVPTHSIVKTIPPLTLSFITNLAGGLMITVLAVLLLPAEARHIDSSGYWYIFLYSLSFFVLGATLYYYAFRSIAPWVIASCLSLEVVVGIILAALLFDEIPTLTQGVGALVVLMITILISRMSPSGEVYLGDEVKSEAKD